MKPIRGKKIKAAAVLSALLFVLHFSGLLFVGYAAQDNDISTQSDAFAESINEGEQDVFAKETKAKELQKSSIQAEENIPEAMDESYLADAIETGQEDFAVNAEDGGLQDNIPENSNSGENEEQRTSDIKSAQKDGVLAGDLGLETAGMPVADEAELQQQLDIGGAIVLANDITLTDTLQVTSDASIDGKGYSLLLETSMTNRHIEIIYDAKLTIEDIKISGNGKGGGIRLDSGRLEILTNADINGNFSLNSGGGVDAVDATVVLSGGTVRDNISKNGGGIAISQDAVLDFAAGTVSGNTANQFGGGIYAPNGNILLGDKAIVKGNKAISGGGVYAKTATVNGAEISSNTALSSGEDKRYTEGLGGGVFAEENINIQSGVLKNNEAGYGGGAYSGGSIDFTGGTITENRAVYLFPGNSVSGDTGAGGGLYAHSITMSGGLINKNVLGTTTAPGRGQSYVGGAGLAVADNGTLNINSGIISENDYFSSTNGGGIYTGKNSTVILEGDLKVTGNYAVGHYSSGGGMYADKNSNVTVRGDVQFSKNKAFQGGGISVGDKSVLTISGNVNIFENLAYSGSGVLGSMISSSTGYSETSTLYLLGGTITRNTDNEEGNIAAVYGYDVTIDGANIVENVSVNGYASAICAHRLEVKSGLIKGNVANGLNEYYPNGTVLVNEFYMSGGEISGNGATGSKEMYGGGVHVMLDDVDGQGKESVRVSGGKISGNTANYGGGMLVMADTGTKNHKLVFSGGTISGNHSYSGGGGIYFSGSVENNNQVIMENISIDGNTSDKFGAGIASNGISISMANGTKLTNNDAKSSSGGGIYVFKNALLSIDGTKKPVYITGNKAVAKGGGICMSALKNLTVKNVVFENNTAEKGYFINDETDIALHKSKISGYTLSAPFTEYAYNNYDIAYTKGVLLEYFAVDFDSMGGTPVSRIEKTIAGKPVSAPKAPSKTGYTFEKWTEDKAGAGAPWRFSGENPATAMPAKNLVLYAQWRVKSYTVNFESNGGTPVAQQSVNYGEFAKEPANPVKEGYTFEGWYGDSALSSKWVFASAAITADTTLYAKWEKVPAPSSSKPKPSSSSSSKTTSSSSKITSSSSVSSSTLIVSSIADNSSSYTSSRPVVSRSVVSSSLGSSSSLANSSSASSSSSSAASSVPVPSLPSESVSTQTAQTEEISPVTSEQQRDITRKELIDSGVPVLDIGGTEVPLFGTNTPMVWSLFNLIVTIISIIIAVFMLVRFFVKRNNQITIRHRIFMLVSSATGVLTTILFFIISTLSGLMVIFDEWSLLMFIMLAVQIIFVVISTRKAQNQETV